MAGTVDREHLGSGSGEHVGHLLPGRSARTSHGGDGPGGGRGGLEVGRGEGDEAGDLGPDDRRVDEHVTSDLGRQDPPRVGTHHPLQEVGHPHVGTPTTPVPVRNSRRKRRGFTTRTRVWNVSPVPVRNSRRSRRECTTRTRGWSGQAGGVGGDGGVQRRGCRADEGLVQHGGRHAGCRSQRQDGSQGQRGATAASGERDRPAVRCVGGGVGDDRGEHRDLLLERGKGAGRRRGGRCPGGVAGTGHQPHLQRPGDEVAGHPVERVGAEPDAVHQHDDGGSVGGSELVDVHRVEGPGGCPAPTARSGRPWERRPDREGSRPVDQSILPVTPSTKKSMVSTSS